MITRDILDEVHARLMLEYRGLWSIEQSEALYREFSGQVNNADFVEAVRRHQHDRTEGSRGIPVGQYPPTSANIEAHLVAINVERMRAKQQDRSKENDQTYRAAVLGDRPSHDERTREWGRKIRAEVNKAQEIRKVLESHYQLDYLEQQDRLFLLCVLDAAKDEQTELLLPVDQALAVAGGIRRHGGCRRVRNYRL